MQPPSQGTSDYRRGATRARAAARRANKAVYDPPRPALRPMTNACLSPRLLELRPLQLRPLLGVTSASSACKMHFRSPGPVVLATVLLRQCDAFMTPPHPPSFCPSLALRHPTNQRIRGLSSVSPRQHGGGRLRMVEPPAVLDGGAGLFLEGGADEGVAKHFLETYWQKRPVLIRGGCLVEAPGGQGEPLLTPDELAGLACDEDVESRVIVHWEGLEKEQGGALEQGSGTDPWEAKHGPFTEEAFQGFPETHYTLLVQEVNRHVPEVSSLLDRFRFVPNWRVDDVMVSYAARGGGVGPHVDSYDVFLVQGLGTRRWGVSMGAIAAAEEPNLLIPDISVRVLREGSFTLDEEWDLEPGDVLYVPPGAVHWGTARTDDCMTYSVGFRAPCVPDMIAEYTNHVTDGMEGTALMADPGLALQRDPGRIGEEAVDQAYGALREALCGEGGRERFAAWFGGYVTERTRGGRPWEAIDAGEAELIVGELAEGSLGALQQAEGVKFAWRREEGRVAVFAGGKAFSAPLSGDEGKDAALEKGAAVICGASTVTGLGPFVGGGSGLRGVVLEMVTEGLLYVEAPHDEDD